MEAAETHFAMNKNCRQLAGKAGCSSPFLLFTKWNPHTYVHIYIHWALTFIFQAKSCQTHGTTRIKLENARISGKAITFTMGANLFETCWAVEAVSPNHAAALSPHPGLHLSAQPCAAASNLLLSSAARTARFALFLENWSVFGQLLRQKASYSLPTQDQWAPRIHRRKVLVKDLDWQNSANKGPQRVTALHTKVLGDNLTKIISKLLA